MSVEIRPAHWSVNILSIFSEVAIIMAETILWTAAPSSTLIWEQILEFRSGKFNDSLKSHQSLALTILRKLYEPALFPGAPIFPLFDKYFGKIEERDFSEVNIV